VPSGFHSPLFLGVQRGWYRDEGVDLDIRDGRGSGPTINLVAAGQADVGYVDLTSLVLAVAKGVPAKAIAMLIRTSGQGVIVAKGSGLARPEDFRGKEIITNSSSTEAAFFKGFLATAGMTERDVKLVGVDSAAKESSILLGRGDAAVAPLPYLKSLLAGKRDFDFVSFAAFGVDLLDNGLVAGETAIRTKGPALKAFLAVTARSYQYAVDGHVKEAVGAMIAMRPDAGINPQVAADFFSYDVPLIASPTTAGKPIGYMSAADWDHAIATLQHLGLVGAEVKAADMYDMSFQSN
jgi:NitT/TauT family transport system substrate-binding protein